MNNEVLQPAENFAEETVENLTKKLKEDVSELKNNFSSIQTELKTLSNKLINNLTLYKSRQYYSSSIGATVTKLDFLKDEIYSDFFQLQNLINAFLGQKIIITYVHVDDNGRREIRLIENDVKNIDKSQRYPKLEYQMNKHYAILKNSLQKEDNDSLQSTAMEVEQRFQKYRGKILWQIDNQWVGYEMWNRGPINEAFVDFYINNVKLVGDLFNRINTFMTSDSPKGVIAADTANGFLIGDVSYNNLQFAVKGVFGSPQGFIQVIGELEKMKNDNFSETSLQEFINKFTKDAEEKARSLVKPMAKDTIQRYITEFTEEQLKSLTK